MRASHAPKVGGRLRCRQRARPVLEARDERFFRLAFEGTGRCTIGSRPRRRAAAAVHERDATAPTRRATRRSMRATPGAVAAPTAGLHFDEPLLAAFAPAASSARS